MNPVFANDLPLMLADFGGRVVWGAFVSTGILAMATEDLVSEDGFAIVRGETPILTYERATLPGLKGRDLLSHEDPDGVARNYRVKHVDLVNDGLQAMAYLERA